MNSFCSVTIAEGERPHYTSSYQQALQCHSEFEECPFKKIKTGKKEKHHVLLIVSVYSFEVIWGVLGMVGLCFVLLCF